MLYEQRKKFKHVLACKVVVVIVVGGGVVVVAVVVVVLFVELLAIVVVVEAGVYHRGKEAFTKNSYEKFGQNGKTPSESPSEFSQSPSVL